MAKIFLKFNEQVLKEIPLEEPQLTIGRKPDNDLVIDNPAVSGHHARIVKEEGAFFVEDLGSTNGTFLNDAKVQKQKLKNTDRVSIGKHALHALIYQDEVAAPPPPPPLPKKSGSDKTMILDTAKQKELMKALGTVKTTSVAEKLGWLTVATGDTDRPEYELTGRLTVIGKEDTATIKLTGWLAPQKAALISRRGLAYIIIIPAEGAKKITVNGEDVQGQRELQDGDVIIVAGVHFHFVLKEPGK